MAQHDWPRSDEVDFSSDQLTRLNRYRDIANQAGFTLVLPTQSRKSPTQEEGYGNLHPAQHECKPAPGIRELDIINVAMLAKLFVGPIARQTTLPLNQAASARLR